MDKMDIRRKAAETDISGCRGQSFIADVSEESCMCSHKKADQQ